MAISRAREHPIRSSVITGGKKKLFGKFAKDELLMKISRGREQPIYSSILTGGATMATGCAGWAGTLRKEKSFGQEHFFTIDINSI